MNEMTFTGGKLRMEAFAKLKVFLKNPGRFCLIVLGSRGAGKRYAIEQSFDQIRSKDNEKLCLKDLHFIEPKDIPNNEDKLDEFFSNYLNNTIVIEDVEDLSSEQEKLLFKALSTSNGKFGVVEKKFEIRIVFTSSKDSDSLREDGKYLTGLFWDRISQLIVEFPSYKQEGENIIKDFHSTWTKMNFKIIEEYKTLAELPKNASFEKFLEDNAEKFDGGFRDLDKLACMYFNYRIYLYNDTTKIVETIEKKVVESVKSDFFTKSQMQGNSGNDASFFQIRPGFTMDDLLGQFKIQVRKWARKEYGTIAKAEEKLKLGRGTMKNYVEGKATKSQKSQK